MSDSICFNRNIFLTMVFIIIVATALYTFNNPKTQTFCPACPPCKINVTKEIITKKEEIQESQEPEQKTRVVDIEVSDPIREMDYKRLEDPLAPPYRRLPRHAYPPNHVKNIINYPTRGYPDNFHYVGNLVRKSDEKFIKLFGRQTYPGSNKYEYYGITTDTNGMETKIPIKNSRDEEFMDNDLIDVEIYSNGGQFKLYLNEFDAPRYNPFLY